MPSGALVLLGPGDVAVELGITREAVRQLTERGKLRPVAVTRGARMHLFGAGDVERLKAERRKAAERRAARRAERERLVARRKATKRRAVLYLGLTKVLVVT